MKVGQVGQSLLHKGASTGDVLFIGAAGKEHWLLVTAMFLLPESI
jgi:hypothetical protein